MAFPRVLSRRSALLSLAAIPIHTFTALAAGPPPPPMTVYKTPACGCCGKWVAHMQQAGFTVTVVDVPSTAPHRQKFGVPDTLASCHTAFVGGYAIEGHVPSGDVRRLLKEKPANAKGIAVPGMPVGSPGMEQGSGRQPYAVLLFDSAGKSRVFASYDAR